MDRTLKDILMEHGPSGNVESGRNCSVYRLEDSYVKLADDVTVDTVEMYMDALDATGIAYPDTEVWQQDIPYYGLGETTVVHQDAAEPALEELIAEPERYINRIREIGLRAASNDIKIDLGLDNLAFIEGELGIVDFNDQEALWLDEDLALHLMGSHLLNSVNKMEREQGLYSPELYELAHNWKKSV
ncbi:hypothetical protein ACK3SF_03055 [Candidatus Nanosalina sp. VS9-1]|uniref:hypothetical protein n=1 Tax=Candidatus Nanosalina sp. VS9-1 TaxID=3388566 RepID=UPI0039E12099